jgi:O-antigen/teichoic acid export membrane protein
MALVSLNGNIPRYFVEHYQGERELGIYAALAYVVVAGTIVVNALGQSAVPRLARYYASGDLPRFRILLLRLVGIGALIGVLGIAAAVIAGRQILTLLYKPDYAARTDVFVVLMIGAALGFVASFLGYGMTAARYFRIQAPLFAAVAGITTLACAILVPSNGIMAAAQAGILAALSSVLAAAVVVAVAMRRAPIEGRRTSSYLQ